MREQGEVVFGVGVPILAVGVIVQAGEQDRPRGAARCRGAKAVREADTLSREPVKVGRLGDRISVGAGVQARSSATMNRTLR